MFEDIAMVFYERDRQDMIVSIRDIELRHAKRDSYSSLNVIPSLLSR